MSLSTADTGGSSAAPSKIGNNIVTNAWLDQSYIPGEISKNFMVNSAVGTAIFNYMKIDNANNPITAGGITADDWIKTDGGKNAILKMQQSRCSGVTSTLNGDASYSEPGGKEYGDGYRCYGKSGDDAMPLVNIASRMMQKEALHHAQCASFIGIIIVQWADLVICKTRWLSLRVQGMENPVMNFALVFELILGSFLCYVTPIGIGLGTRPLRFTHWFIAMPFSMCILIYDETRKYFMRQTSLEETDKVTGRTLRTPGWLEKNTYY